MTTAIRISSIANRFLSEQIFLGPPWTRFQELPPEKKDHDDTEQQIDDGKRGKWYEQSGHRSYGIARPHNSIDDPRLSAEFGHEPAGFYCDESKRRTTNQCAQQPFVIRQSPSPPPNPSHPGGNGEQGGSCPYHNVEGQM